MPRPRHSDDEIIRLFSTVGATETAARLGLTERNVYKRRTIIEQRLGRPINAPRKGPTKKYPHRQEINIQNGTVIVGSDFHIWPGKESTALRAFKKFCGDLDDLQAIILNGDVFDFPKISRHPPMGWETAPGPQEEIEAVQDHLSDIAKAPRRRKVRKIHTLGNHDARFEVRLATIASEYKGVKGIHLSDHLPAWEKGWSCFINDDVVVKHRFPKGGQHATSNNPLWSGRTTVQGHLHAQQVRPFTDYNGTRYGVDAGCIADTDHKAFVDYTEDGALNWRSGFAVLTFRDGDLLPPELVTKWDDNRVCFRGELIKV